MSLLWVVIGCVFELILAWVFFVVSIFNNGSAPHYNSLSSFKKKILAYAPVILPGSCVLAGALVIRGYINEENADTYLWLALPLVLAIPYFMITKKRPNKKKDHSQK